MGRHCLQRERFRRVSTQDRAPDVFQAAAAGATSGDGNGGGGGAKKTIAVATDVLSGAPVVLKCQSQAHRWQRELEVAQRVRSVHVARLLSAYADGPAGVYCSVYEMGRISLHELLATKGRPGPLERELIAESVVSVAPPRPIAAHARSFFASFPLRTCQCTHACAARACACVTGWMCRGACVGFAAARAW